MIGIVLRKPWMAAATGVVVGVTLVIALLGGMYAAYAAAAPPAFHRALEAATMVSIVLTGLLAIGVVVAALCATMRKAKEAATWLRDWLPFTGRPHRRERPMARRERPEAVGRRICNYCGRLADAAHERCIACGRALPI